LRPSCAIKFPDHKLAAARVPRFARPAPEHIAMPSTKRRPPHGAGAAFPRGSVTPSFENSRVGLSTWGRFREGRAPSPGRVVGRPAPRPAYGRFAGRSPERAGEAINAPPAAARRWRSIPERLSPVHRASARPRRHQLRQSGRCHQSRAETRLRQRDCASSAIGLGGDLGKKIPAAILKSRSEIRS
jgi:hypothetical protein